MDGQEVRVRSSNLTVEVILFYFIFVLTEDRPYALSECQVSAFDGMVN